MPTPSVRQIMVEKERNICGLRTKAISSIKKTKKKYTSIRKRAIEPRPHPPDCLNKRFWDEVRAGRIKPPNCQPLPQDTNSSASSRRRPSLNSEKVIATQKIAKSALLSMHGGEAGSKMVERRRSSTGSNQNKSNSPSSMEANKKVEIVGNQQQNRSSRMPSAAAAVEDGNGNNTFPSSFFQLPSLLPCMPCGPLVGLSPPILMPPPNFIPAPPPPPLSSFFASPSSAKPIGSQFPFPFNGGIAAGLEQHLQHLCHHPTAVESAMLAQLMMQASFMNTTARGQQQQQSVHVVPHRNSAGGSAEGTTNAAAGQLSTSSQMTSDSIIRARQDCDLLSTASKSTPAEHQGISESDMQIDSLINSIPFIGKENNGKKTSTKECQLKRELQSPAADDSSCSENIATSSRNPIEQLKDNNPRRLCILPIPIPFPVPIPLTSDFILMNYGRQ